MTVTESCDQRVEDGMVRVCRTYGEKRNVNRVFVGKPEGRWLDVSPRDREVDEVEGGFKHRLEGC